jgi:hypothetical protein
MSCAPSSAPRRTSPKIGDRNWLARFIAQAPAADRQPESDGSVSPWPLPAMCAGRTPERHRRGRSASRPLSAATRRRLQARSPGPQAGTAPAGSTGWASSDGNGHTYSSASGSLRRATTLPAARRSEHLAGTARHGSFMGFFATTSGDYSRSRDLCAAPCSTKLPADSALYRPVAHNCSSSAQIDQFGALRAVDPF